MADKKKVTKKASKRPSKKKVSKVVSKVTTELSDTQLAALHSMRSELMDLRREMSALSHDNEVLLDNENRERKATIGMAMLVAGLILALAYTMM